jgi:pSer/pThr/pTyr-binding forkhead associated (FHA) protein
MPNLLIQGPSGPAYLVVLTAPSSTVGRAAINDVALDDPRVSRFHAVLNIDEPFVTIEDLASKNGVFVNGQRVSIDVLTHGDMLTLGDCHIRFVAEEQEYSHIEAEAMSSIPGPKVDIGPPRKVPPRK